MRHFNLLFFYICAHRLKCWELSCSRSLNLILFFNMWSLDNGLWLPSWFIEMRCDLALILKIIRELIVLICKIQVQSILKYRFIIELRLSFVHLLIDLIGRKISETIFNITLTCVQMIGQIKWHSEITLIFFMIAKL